MGRHAFEAVSTIASTTHPIMPQCPGYSMSKDRKGNNKQHMKGEQQCRSFN